MTIWVNVTPSKSNVKAIYGNTTLSACFKIKDRNITIVLSECASVTAAPEYILYIEYNCQKKKKANAATLNYYKTLQ